MSSAHYTLLRRWIWESPPVEWILKKVKDLIIQALRQGPIPQHVAFVMDGNRRFARNHQIETVEGHNLGFEALARVLEVCYKSGVKAVTIYAFSIENFKRPKYEVDALMDMAKVKLSQLAQHGQLLDRYGASIRVLGQRELVKPDVLAAVDKAVDLTKHNKDCVLNVCFPYTSREEITTAIRSTVAEYSQPLQHNKLQRPFSESRITANIRSRHLSTLTEEASRSVTPEPRLAPPSSGDRDHSSSTSSLSESTTPNRDFSPSTSYPHSPESFTDGATETAPIYSDPEKITAQTLTDHMFTATTPPLDLLIRTSGVERLSDFMLWQCHEHTSIKFISCLWPEFDLWHFLPVLVEWQWWRRKGDEVYPDGKITTPRIKTT